MYQRMTAGYKLDERVSRLVYEVYDTCKGRRAIFSCSIAALSVELVRTTHHLKKLTLEIGRNFRTAACGEHVFSSFPAGHWFADI